MSGEPTPAAPRPRRKPIFGPEPWREVAGRTWSHWDLWFCLVLVSDFDCDWVAFSEELWRHRSPYLLTLDEEAKVSHLDDLRARERLWCRAMHGRWERFPVSPASAHARFADQAARTRRRGRRGYGITQALWQLLDDPGPAAGGRSRRPAGAVARAAHRWD